VTLASLFALSGTVHLLRPSVFEPLIPDWVPGSPTTAVVVSGVAELACAYGLFTRRRWAGPTSAALLLAVWPGNLEMALDATREEGLASPLAVVAWARMPLQIPLIWMALQNRPAAEGQPSRSPQRT
jgi:uncharacterized membrane protein